MMKQVLCKKQRPDSCHQSGLNIQDAQWVLAGFGSGPAHGGVRTNRRGAELKQARTKISTSSSK